MQNFTLKRSIAFFDIESTGVDPYKDRIVEISIIKIHQDGKEEFLTSIINPQIPIPQESTQIHGIKDEDVINKPTFKEFSKNILNFIEGCDLAGFNIKNFDLPMLEEEFKRNNIEFSRKEKSILDIMSIYHKFNPRTLTSAYKDYCGKDLNGAHRSEADVRATLEVFKSQINAHSLPDNLIDLQNLIHPKNPLYIDENGKFIWSNNKATFNFGKHKGKSLEEVRSLDKGFLEWMLTKDFPPEILDIVKGALKGEFLEKEGESVL